MTEHTDSARLEPGQMAPDFSLTADDGSTLRLTDLLARGRNVIVYFYPAAMTPRRRL